MSVNYPNGKKTSPKVEKNLKPKALSAANRGMSLEKLINAANEYYKMNNIGLFSKRPTPINIVKADYSKGVRITNAYFEKQSTTDYNGVYKGKYFDFEAKSTKLKTSFPLSNIYDHQIVHLQNVIKHGGFAFFIIDFSSLNEIYVINASFIIDCFNKKERMSIPYLDIKENGVLIKLGINPHLPFLDGVNSIFDLA